MLDSIELAGFKSIREMRLEMCNLNVLIGANGAGKSNLISFFKLLNYMLTNSLQQYIGEAGFSNAVLHYGAKHTQQLSAILNFTTEAGRNVYHMRLASAAEDTLIFADEAVSFSRKGLPGQAPLVSLGAGYRESRLLKDNHAGLEGRSKANLQTIDVIRSIMQRWRVYHFHDTSPEAKIRNRGYLYDNLYLRHDAGNLATFLYTLKDKHEPYYMRIVSSLRTVIPFFDDFVLQPNPLWPDYIGLNWREKGTHPDTVFGPHQLSDGTLRLMALITVLLQPQLPELIIIDEPELGLHPFAISFLAALLKSVSLKTQIIVSTQSSTLVDHLEPEHVVVVDRIDGQSVFSRLDEAELDAWLEEYSLGELWNKNVFGGRPR